MSTVETRKFEPATGTAVNLGASGDAVTLPAGVTLKTNTIKDAGGNTIFTSDGAGTLSSVNSALQGGMVFISSQTASSSASLSFTSGIDSTYDEYLLIGVNIKNATGTQRVEFQASTDGGSSYGVTATTTAFADYHYEDNSAYGLDYWASQDLAQSTSYQMVTPATGSDADQSSCFTLNLFAPSSTTYVKQFYLYGVAAGQHPSSYNAHVAGYFNTTSAINGLNFKSTSGNITAGTIYLYGIK